MFSYSIFPSIHKNNKIQIKLIQHTKREKGIYRIFSTWNYLLEERVCTY